MQYQRKLNHEGSLPEDKVDLIDKLGDFDWDITPREKSNHKNKDPAAWESRFKDMVAFKEENGHCTVPPIYEPNPALAKWVASQKAKHAKGNLPEDKLAKMTCIMHLLQKTWSSQTWVFRSTFPSSTMRIFSLCAMGYHNSFAW